MTGRRDRRRKKLLDGLKERRRYWELKDGIPVRGVWRSRFGIGYGSIVRQATEYLLTYSMVQSPS